MFVLTILNNDGAVLWTEDFRTIASVYYRAPDAISEGDNRYSTCVDDLVMATYSKGPYAFPAERGYARA